MTPATFGALLSGAQGLPVGILASFRIWARLVLFFPVCVVFSVLRVLFFTVSHSGFGDQLLARGGGGETGDTRV